MSKTDELDIYEGQHLSILEDWIDKGKKTLMPPEISEYLEEIDYARSQWNRAMSPQRIIRSLTVVFPRLDKLTAKSRFEDAVNHFFLDRQVKKEQWRNILFERQLQLVEAAILSAKTVDDYDKASKMLERAYKMKGLDKDEDEKLPEGIFEKNTTVFSLNPKDLGLPGANRSVIMDMINKMNIEETDKIRIKQEASTSPKEIFEWDGKEED